MLSRIPGRLVIWSVIRWDPDLGGSVPSSRYGGPVIRNRVLISGQVQGVYFRDSDRLWALQHGVAGWVRNLPDGRVEAVLEGLPEEVHRAGVLGPSWPPCGGRYGRRGA